MTINKTTALRHDRTTVVSFLLFFFSTARRASSSAHKSTSSNKRLILQSLKTIFASRCPFFCNDSSNSFEITTPCSSSIFFVSLHFCINLYTTFLTAGSSESITFIRRFATVTSFSDSNLIPFANATFNNNPTKRPYQRGDRNSFLVIFYVFLGYQYH